jgi:lipoteichoic acid synthase
MGKFQHIKRSHMVLFLIAVVIFSVKTYLSYRIEFNLGIEDNLQKFLLFFNPLSSALFFLGLALLSKKHTKMWMIIIHFLLSLLLYSDIVYYRYFTDFITIPDIVQAFSNAKGLGNSAASLMYVTDIFYFSDTIILIVLALTVFKNTVSKKQSSYKLIFIIAVTFFLFNLGLAEKDKPALLSHTFDRNYLVKYMGVYNFTIFDIFQNIEVSSLRALASSSDITTVENYRKNHYTAPNPKYFGKAKGMNVIYVSMESFQNFLIDYKMPNGQAVTPFLNSLAHDGNTFYFDNFYHQTAQGKTSDAEFLMENSIYPLSSGAVFVNKDDNTFQASPAILQQKGYTTAVFHGNYKEFWNRDNMYKQLGYQDFYDASYYDMAKGNTKNFGMKDKPFFAESMSMLENLKQPFYTKFITLSNHFPFEMDPGDTSFSKGNFDDSIVDNYFQSAHYMDAALKQFFDALKADGLFDNTVVILYGDHYGISENHNATMAKVLGVPSITPVMNAKLQEVPLFIHVPGVKGGVQHQVGGEVDVRPTLLHLLGIDTKKYIEFGSDLLSTDHRNWVLSRNGNFVSTQVSQINGRCYDTNTGNLTDSQTACKSISSEVINDLKMSDKVVNEDLLRFYTPKGFTPVNPNNYQYNGPKKK